MARPISSPLYGLAINRGTFFTASLTEDVLHQEYESFLNYLEYSFNKILKIFLRSRCRALDPNLAKNRIRIWQKIGSETLVVAAVPEYEPGRWLRCWISDCPKFFSPLPSHLRLVQKIVIVVCMVLMLYGKD